MATALAAKRMGDVAVAGSTSSTRPTSDRMYHATRAHRSFVIGGMIIEALRAADAIIRRMLARYRQQRQARAVHDALQALDDHTLRDLGFHRSEITSVAAELTGEVEATRVRTSPAWRDPANCR